MKGRNIIITLVFAVCVALLLKAGAGSVIEFIDKKIDNQITGWAGNNG